MKSILSLTGGRFFTVIFRKRDGSIRRMNCRTGVTRYVKGTGLPRNSEHLLTVYDVQVKGYRSIPVDRVVAIRYAGAEIVPM
jgi:hypothetical protein